MKIYVGNLSYETTEDELRQAFESYGRVTSINIIQDKYSGRSKGFGFIEMESSDEANEAMSDLNGTELNGRSITVNEARPRREDGGGGGGGRKFSNNRNRNNYRRNY